MSIPPIRIVWTLAFALVGSARVTAQGGPLPTPEQCAAANATLRDGQLSQVDSQNLARAMAGECGSDGARAFADALLRRKALEYTDDLSAFFFGNVIDTAVVRATLSLATDPSASEAVRVLSLRLLANQITPGAHARYEDIRSVAEGEQCMLFGTPEPGVEVPTELFPVVLPQIRAAVSPLERDGSQPSGVRGAGNCAMNAWRRASSLPLQPLTALSATTLQLQHLCSDVFSITNESQSMLLVFYSADGGVTRKKLRLRPGTTAQPAITHFREQSAGTVTVYLDGEQILSAQRGAASCS